MKTVLITGISKGIGKALAEKFLAEGFEVLGTIYTGSAPVEHENLLVFNLDLASRESVADCATKIASTGKTIDILINNAGALLDEEETHVVVEKLLKTLEINLIGTIDFTNHILPLIIPGGHIINMSSTAGSLELEAKPEGHYPLHYPSYKISKAALNMYTRTLAQELMGKIIVSSVHPGWVKTDMGGEEADMTPEEAAVGIYNVAISNPETSQFRFGDQKVPW